MVAAIFVVLAFASFLTWLGMYKEDAWLVIFAGIVFIFAGLSVLINGMQDLDTTYSIALGIVITFLGAYFATRSTVELVVDNL